MRKLLTGVVDDHPLFVDAIVGILQHHEWSEVKFTGNDAASLMNYVQTNPLDLLLLDISLPDANGILLIKQLRKHMPALRILVLTTHQPADINLYRDDCHFDAYVLKISGRKVLEEAFIQIRLGQYFLDPNLVFPEIKNTINPVQLTKREKEIIALITAGKTTREIAAQLYLSEQTIKTHRRNISEKLDGKNVSDLIYKMNQLKEK